MFFEIGDRSLIHSVGECVADRDVVKPAVVILALDEALAFESVGCCCFPRFEEIVAVVIQVESINYVVLPDGRVAIDTVGRVVRCAASASFCICRASWWRIIRRVHPEFILMEFTCSTFCCCCVFVVGGSVVGGRCRRGRGSRPIHHGVGDDAGVVLY